MQSEDPHEDTSSTLSGPSSHQNHDPNKSLYSLYKYPASGTVKATANGLRQIQLKKISMSKTLKKTHCGFPSFSDSHGTYNVRHSYCVSGLGLRCPFISATTPQVKYHNTYFIDERTSATYMWSQWLEVANMQT